MNLNIQSRLMKNYESGSPLASDQEMAATMDEAGNLMFFSIGTDSHLYMFRKAPGTPTGWSQTDLTADLGVSTVAATHLAVAQGADGKPILAVSLYDNAFRNNPRV